MSGYTLRGTVVNPVRAYIQLPGGNRRRQVLYAGPRKHPYGKVSNHGDNLISPGFLDIRVVGYLN